VQQPDELAPAQPPPDAVPEGEAGLGEPRRANAAGALKAGDGAEGPRDAGVRCHQPAFIARRCRLPAGERAVERGRGGEWRGGGHRQRREAPAGERAGEELTGS
jgi:hypothetical protein